MRKAHQLQQMRASRDGGACQCMQADVEGDNVINSGVVAVRHLCLYAAR